GGGYVYWRTDALRRVALTGGNAETVPMPTSFTGTPRAMAADDQSLYLIDGAARIFAVPHSAEPARMLASDPTSAIGALVANASASAVYYLDAHDPKIVAVPKDGSPSITVTRLDGSIGGVRALTLG